MGRHYRLDDPALQQRMKELAAETAASWPPLTEEVRAKLARLLAPQPAHRPTIRQTPQRRAA